MGPGTRNFKQLIGRNANELGKATENGGGDSPPPLGAIGSSKKPRSTAMGTRRGGPGLENSGRHTRISKQPIGGNADELQKTMENGGKELGGRGSPSPLPQFPFQSAPPADGGAGEAVSPIGESPPPGELSYPTNNRRSRPSEGTSLRSSAPLVSRHPARSVNSPMGGAGWPRIFNRPPIAQMGAD